MPIDTIIFDLDGVIIDTEILWDKSQTEFLRQLGCIYEREKIKHLITGTSMIDGIRILQKVYAFSGNPEELVGMRIAITKEFFKNEISFMRGFEEFFERMKNKNYKMAIGTALDKELLEIVDEKLNLSKMFNGSVCCIQDVGNLSKPNPAIFLHAAKLVGSLPESCVVIEDGPRGIEAAINAGMRNIGITTTYTKEKLEDADFVVNSFNQISDEMFQ